MNWEAVSAAAAVLVPLAGLFATIFWKTAEKLRADIDEQKKRADEVERQLAAHRLHVAENYVTNAELARAIEGMNKSFSEVFVKLDRLMDSKADKDCHR
jgi:hypothetical protein